MSKAMYCDAALSITDWPGDSCSVSKGFGSRVPVTGSSPKSKKGQTCTDRSQDRHRRAVIRLLDLAYVYP